MTAAVRAALAQGPAPLVLAMLTRAGHRAHVVGGAVRDALLGRPLGDIDIATDARPPRVVALADAAGFRTVPLGIEHGTVAIVTPRGPVEVTTYRRDVQTDGRHALVAFGGTMKGDAARRDFTINALYADANGRVRDPLGTGRADLAAGRVRFIGRAAARIAEDRLRSLRFFRFHAWFADPMGGVDAEALAACAAAVPDLGLLSRERVGAEMRKLLAAPDPAPAVAAMAASGVLAALLPGADPTGIGPLVAFEAMTGAAPDWRARLAALTAADGARALRLSRCEARAVGQIAAWARDGTDPAEVAWRHGADLGLATALVAAALCETPPPRGLPDRMARAARSRFPLRAADFAPLEGPALGAAIRAAEARWIASDFTLGAVQLRP